MKFSKLIWIGLALALAAGCSGNTETAESPVIRPAKLEMVVASSNLREFSFPAVVEASQTAQLTFQISGQIEQLSVLESQKVKKGEIIARLDQRDVKNLLSQSQAQFDNAEAEYARADRLLEQNAISKSVLEARRTQRDVAKAALDSANKALSDTVLKAPFDGVISRVTGEQFQNVQAKEAVVVMHSSEVEVVFDVPGTIMARIPQLEFVDTYVALDAQPDLKIPAVFKEASAQAEAASQTYRVNFTFIAPENLLILPGMTATIVSNVKVNNAPDILPDGIAVPLASILAEGEDRFVWLVDRDTYAISKRQVTIDSDVGVYVTVTNGLEGGETIVSAGVSFFHEGMIVREWKPE